MSSQTPHEQFLEVLNSISYLTADDYTRLLGAAFKMSEQQAGNETYDVAKKKVEQGDFSFKAIGNLVREQNKIIYSKTA